jgi:hypothetical protein
MPTNTNDPTDTITAQLLVCLPTLTDDEYEAVSLALTAAFPSRRILVASRSPGIVPQDAATLTVVPYKTERAELGWVLTAADYRAAAETALEHNADTVLLLSNSAGSENRAGSNAAGGSAGLLRGLVNCMDEKKIDLAVPRFALGPHDGLVNAALLYPLTRALFGTDIHAPLPVAAAFSARMAQRLVGATPHQPATQSDALLWPVAEAAIAGLSVREVETDSAPPAPPDGDFNALFHSVAGSLFADVDAKASFWQRARAMPARAAAKPADRTASDVSSEVAAMIENFHLAQANLQEIWSLVLPPQTRLEIKRLSQLPSDAFAVTPSLWARTVYDFALAYHLRTLNRGHLLGAMTPLYLAWVASFLRTTANDATRARRFHEQTAAAFEAEKPYLVSRWRWPDRFNP